MSGRLDLLTHAIVLCGIIISFILYHNLMSFDESVFFYAAGFYAVLKIYTILRLGDKEDKQ